MADVVPVRARFRTVKSQCTGHNRRPCTCSVTKNVDILSALALSHQACQSELGFSRVAPRCGRLTAMGKKVGQKEFAEGLRRYHRPPQNRLIPCTYRKKKVILT